VLPTQAARNCIGRYSLILEGSLGSISATQDSETKLISLALATKRDREASTIQPLEAILVTITLFEHNVGLSLDVIPDTEANVTAIPLAKAKEIELSKTKVVLCIAGSDMLNVLGSCEAYVGL
jgi:hypothetical protein